MDTLIKARVPQALKTSLERIALDQMMSASDVIRQALVEYAERWQARKTLAKKTKAAAK